MLYLPLHAVVVAPLGELADEGVGNLARQGLPVLLVLVGKDLGELGDGEVGEVHQAGRVVDDHAQGHAVARVQIPDAARRGRADRLVPEQRERGARGRDRRQELPAAVPRSPLSSSGSHGSGSIPWRLGSSENAVRV